MTIRIEENEYKIIMKELIDRDESFQSYVMNLIRNDLKINPEEKK